jgi:hypothetical protein
MERDWLPCDDLSQHVMSRILMLIIVCVFVSVVCSLRSDLPGERLVSPRKFGTGGDIMNLVRGDDTASI